MAMVAGLFADYARADAEVDNGVLIFTDENFDTEIAKYE
jgi:hypothetical protein